MVIDSSALIAILLNEAERERFLDLILEAEADFFQQPLR